MAHRWQEAREQREREIKRTLQQSGFSEREAADFAARRAKAGMERAVRMAHDEGTSSPTEIRST